MDKVLKNKPVAFVLTNCVPDWVAPYPPFYMPLLIKEEKGFEGINRMGTTHKPSLYADDDLLYILNPV